MPTPELDVLKPIDPAITDSDDYEIYALSDARVWYEVGKGRNVKKGGLASLFDAYADRPLRVEGRLESLNRGQQKYLLRKPFRPVDLEIGKITRYSYGTMTDGTINLWALGEAGWFEIQPAKSYEGIFADAVQAVEILHFVADIYNEPRKRGGGPSAESIFKEYAEEERFHCKDAKAAEQIFRKHKAFLIMSFLDPAQSLGLSNTPLYRYYKRHFPDDFDSIKDRMAGKSKQSLAKLEKAEKSAKGSTEVSKAKSSKLKGKENAKSKLVDNTPKRDNNWWEAAAIFEFMQKCVNQRAMRMGAVTLDKVASLMVRRYEIEEEEIAKNIIRVHGPNLCYMIEHPRRKNIQYFIDEPIYQDLSQGHDLSATEARRAEQVQLHPRRDHATLKNEISSDESESAESIATPRPRTKRSKKGRLSVLRPSGAKYSGKGKNVNRGQGKKPTVFDGGEGDHSEESDTPMMDTPTQAMSAGKRKLPTEDIDVRPRKRAASQSEPEPELDSPPTEDQDEDEDDDDAETGDSSTPGSDAEADPSSAPLPLRWRTSNASAKHASPSLLPPIISTPLPSADANGPGDSWLCTFDGCSQKVYGASTVRGKGLINEHLQDHAQSRTAQIELIMSEEQRLRLPVNNLIKRIREMTEHQQSSLFPDLGDLAIPPAPIERRV